MNKRKKQKSLKTLFYSLLGISVTAVIVIPPSVVSSVSFNTNEKNVNKAIKLFDKSQKIPSQAISFSSNKIIDGTVEQIGYYSANMLNDDNIKNMLENIPSPDSLFTVHNGFLAAPKDLTIDLSVIKNSISTDGTSVEINVKFQSNQSISKYSKTLQIVVGGFISYSEYLTQVNNVMQKGNINYLTNDQKDINFQNSNISSLHWLSPSQFSVSISPEGSKYKITYTSVFDNTITLSATLDY